MSITTKSGDDGTTGLWSGERLPKDDLRIEACGEADELLLPPRLRQARLSPAGDADRPRGPQRELVRVAGEIASIDPAFDNPIQSWDEEDITRKILALEAEIPLLGFVLPGRTEASAASTSHGPPRALFERRAVALARRSSPGAHEAPLSDILRRYLNRLSDYLFMLARAEEAAEGKIEYA